MEPTDDFAEDSELGRAEREFKSVTRLEAQEDERQAAQLSRRSRSLSDVAFEAMSHGDRVSAGVADRTFTGRVVYASGDLMTLDADRATVDFNLQGPLHLRILEPARSGGGSRRDGPGSFRGRLLELEAEPGELEVGSPLFPEGLRGRLQVAAQDHLILRNAAGAEWFVPLSWVAYVATLKD